MTPSIGGLLFPESMRSRGKSYKFHRQPRRDTGQGTLTAAGEQWAEWTFAYLTDVEWAWLVARQDDTTFRLFDRQLIERDYTAGSMRLPDVGPVNGRYDDVTVEFHYLSPAFDTPSTTWFTVGTSVIGGPDRIKFYDS